MSTGTALEIRVHGIDGHMTCFVQRDPEIAKHIVEQVHPNRIFTQPSLILQGETATTVFPCAAVARLDLLTEGYPGWPFYRNVTDVVEITQKDFEEQFRPGTLEAQREESRQTGESLTAYIDITLANAERVFGQLRIQLREATPIDRGLVLQHILVSPSYHMRRPEGGAILINPANIVRLNFHPGPPNVPSAWPAQLLEA